MPGLFRIVRSSLVLVVEMGRIGPFFNQASTKLSVTLSGSIIKRSLGSKLINVVHGIYVIQWHTLVVKKVQQTQLIFAGSIKERRLSVHVLIIEVKPVFNQVLTASDFTIPADVEKDGLVVLIFVLGIGAKLNQDLHHFETVLVGGSGDGEVQSGLAEAQFEFGKDVVIVLFKELSDWFELAE